MSKESVQPKDLDHVWNRFMSQLWGCIPYPVWQYLRGQSVDAIEGRQKQFLKDLKLASSLEEEIVRIAFALRDSEGKLANILLLELDGLFCLCGVRRRFGLLLKDAPIVGASVHFGEPDKRLGVALSVESAMSIVNAANGMPCWACLGPTGLRTLQVPESVREVCVFCDAETSGIVEEAAAALAERLRAEGRTVAVLMPPCEALELSGNVTWHDAWLRAGNRLLRL